MMVHQGDANGECARRGYGFEAVAEKAFNAQGYETKPPANERESIYGHVDFWAKDKHGQWKSVDAKARKKLSRSDNTAQYEWTFIELRNNYGNPGWIAKGADFMCFELEHEVLVVKRERLQEWVNTRVNMGKKVHSSRDAKYCVYTREGRKDLITLIRLDDLRAAQDMILKVWPK